MPATATSLIGRHEELGRLVAALEAALRGEGNLLVIHGEAGIGKSALLAAARREAEERGMGVLGAAGVEAEADIPFAGLTSLLGPLLDLRERLPVAQRSALEGALALAPSAQQPPFGVGAATAALLAAADEGPLAVLVDDVHWLDGESLEAILFAARRLRRDPVAFLLATRPPVEQVGAGLEELALARLGEADAAELLRRQAPKRLRAEALAELAAAADGNPLALVELPRGLGSAEAVEASTRPLRAGAAVEATFGAQLEALAPPVRLALTALAAERDPAPGPLALALARLGVGTAELAAAAAAGFVEAGAGEEAPHFRHPLVRSAAYHGAPAPQRRRVHAALAAAHLAGGERSAAAWHRAAAATEPDAEVAALLDDAAARARARGALSSAAHAARRAAELTPDASERARRFVVAVRDLARTAHPERAAELAAAVVEDCADPLARADLQRLRGEVMIRRGSFEPAVELLAAEADRVAPLDSVRAARMLLSMSVRYRASGDYGAMAAAAERARDLAAGEDAAVSLFADVVLAHVLVVSGRRDEGEALLAKREPELGNPPPGASAELLTSPAHASLWAERPDRAERLTGAVIADARARSAPAALPFPLGIRAQLRFRGGRWQEALADGEEALELARDTGQLALVAFAAGALAEVEAASGRDADCRSHIEAALEIVEPSGSEAIGIYAQTALGLLELGLGHFDHAAEALRRCREAAGRMGMVEASVAHWAGSLVEALDRIGAGPELERLIGELDAAAAVTGGAYAAGAAARGRGLLADADGFAAPLEGSAEIFAAAGLPFEQARSQLALGERLRRARRRREARAPLESALAALRRLGARPWAERARAELAAAGGESLESPPARAEELTAAELRVALLAAAGRTNPEIATELLVSRRTVEHQLSAVYRKLGLRSRTELAAALHG